MIDHERPTTSKHTSIGGIIILNTEGDIIRTNASGNDYLKLLSMAEMYDSMNYRGMRPFDVLMAALRDGDLNPEITINGSPAQVLEVIAVPLKTDFHTLGWALMVHDITDEPSDRSMLVFHWPPPFSLTSNRS